MKSFLSEIIDIVAGIFPWLVLSWVLFGIYNMARADEPLTREQRIVALTILGEARGEGEKGMRGIAAVIVQRSKNRGLTYEQVCLEPWQFSPWNAGGGKVKKESELYHLWKSPSMWYARKLARNMDEVALCEFKNADHFCTLKTNPSWAYDKKKKKWIDPVLVFKNHKFYRLKNN